MNDKTGIQWRKSSYSTGEAGGNECVEVARPDRTVTALRDSKAPDTGHLHIPASSFAAFVTGIKADS